MSNANVGKVFNMTGGSGGGGSGAQYWVADGIDVSRTDEYLAVCYDRFGETARLEVPLDWEGMLS